MTDFVFIDSGIGGIPYMLHMLEMAPQAQCMYVADTANFPYGEKTHEQVVDCVIPLVQKIIDNYSPSVIVLACNTISVNALGTLREKFPDTKFVGTVPAIKLAAAVSKKRAIGLLATKATCENPYNTELKNKFAADCELVCRGDGELVSYIEKNAFTATKQECLDAVKPAVEFFRQKNCDVIILGCTHFLNFTDLFKEACSPDIEVVDSIDGVVRHAIDIGGVAGVSPSQGVGRNEVRPQGDSSPSLFITGEFNTSYEVICSRYKINFIGKI